ncbi:MAG: hypothetical protein RL637_1696, partial [Pseudomonadota bacterium]
MQIFLVGGAVRDQLLQRPVSERDWVVVGGTAEQLLSQGFRAVGRDFPVFLHPQTGEEYALARTERKIAAGYHGFAIQAGESVSLEQDLLRRDLTINAIAQDASGQLIDPYRGLQDLQQRWLRHISPAFAEDPVRILRVARFAARYAHLGFKIADETMDLMRQMVVNGEVEHLVPERVWAEIEKALTEINPEIFFQSLRNCGALEKILPELNQLFGIPQPAHYHPEIDCGIHSLFVLQQASILSLKTSVRFAALVHDLGKGKTPIAILPHHYGHEMRGLAIFSQLANRLKMPNHYRQLAELVIRYHTHIHRAFELKASTLIDLLIELKAFKPPYQINDFLLVCEADAKGRTGFE